MAVSLGVSWVGLDFPGVGDAVPLTAVNDGPDSGNGSGLGAREFSARCVEASAAILDFGKPAGDV